MRSSSTPLALPLAIVPVILLAAGCAETKPPTVPPPVATAVVAAPPPAAPPPDLSPVPEPSDIFVVARWRSPRASIATLSALAGVSTPFLESLVGLASDKGLSKAFRGGVDGHAIAETVSLDGSVDFVINLERGRSQPHPLWAFSIGLASFERAKATLEAAGPVDEIAPGLFRVGTANPGDLTCVIGASAGAAPARLVCGQHDKDVVTLGPYMVRNLAAEPPPAKDVHAEARARPVDARYGGPLRTWLNVLPAFASSQKIGEERFDRGLMDAASGLASEVIGLSNDLDRATLDVELNGSGATATFNLELRAMNSWLANEMIDSGSRAAPPPSLFWRAPKDSDSASYGFAPDPAHYDGIVKALRGLLIGKLAKEKVGSEGDRKALGNLLAFTLHKGTPVVAATGHETTASASAQNAPTDAAIAASLSGWTLIGFDEGPEGISKTLKDWVAVSKREALLKPLAKALDLDVKQFPKARLVPAPAGLGKASLDVEVAIPTDGAAATPTDKDKPATGVAVHLLVMPDGKSTWVAVGVSRDDLVKHLEVVRASAPDSGTLASRPGLEALRSGKGVSNGFVTLATMLSPMRNAVAIHSPQAHKQAAADWVQVIERLPHKAETPMLLSAHIAQGAGPKAEISLNIPKGALEDVGAMVSGGYQIGKTHGLWPDVLPKLNAP